MTLTATGDYSGKQFFSCRQISRMLARERTKLGWDDYTKRYVALGLALECIPRLICSFPESLRETRASSYRSTFLRRLGTPIGKTPSIFAQPSDDWQSTRLFASCHPGQSLRALFGGIQPAPATAQSTDINISVPSDGRDCILPLLDQIFERYGRLRSGECSSSSVELISWFA